MILPPFRSKGNGIWNLSSVRSDLSLLRMRQDTVECWRYQGTLIFFLEFHLVIFVRQTISDIDFLVVIPSAPENHALRQRIRSTWGSAPSKFKRRQLYFFIGLSDNPDTQKGIFRENISWKDIIQPGMLKNRLSS